MADCISVCDSHSGCPVDVDFQVKNFKEYCELYTKSMTDDNDDKLKLVHEVVNDPWEVALTMSSNGFKQMSFVNSIATTKGGRHTDYIADQIVSKLIETVKKKNKKDDAVKIKPFQVNTHKHNVV